MLPERPPLFKQHSSVAAQLQAKLLVLRAATLAAVRLQAGPGAALAAAARLGSAQAVPVAAATPPRVRPLLTAASRRTGVSSVRHQVRLQQRWTMSKNKQANIASFFTRQPKPAGAGKGEAAGSPNENVGPSVAASPAPKRKPDQVGKMGRLQLGWQSHLCPIQVTRP